VSDKEQLFRDEIASVLGVPVVCIDKMAGRLAEPTGASDLRARLIALQVVDQSCPPIRSFGAMLKLDLDAQTVAAVFSTMLTFPISDGTRTFTEYLASTGSIPVADVEPILIESIEERQSTVRSVLDRGSSKTGEVMEALAEFSGTAVATRLELTGRPLGEPAEAVRVALELDTMLWTPKSGEPILLSVRPVMDFVVSVIATHLGKSPRVRLVSPRTFTTRHDKAVALLSPVAPAPQTSFGALFKPKAAAPMRSTEPSTAVPRDTAPLSITRATETSQQVPYLQNREAASIFELIVNDAKQQRATDIHLDPMRDCLRVRIRVDGMLHEIYRIAPEMARQVVARIKILAELDITERRRAQDGQISMSTPTGNLDLRIATVPVNNGERVELRLANMARVISDMSELGLADQNLAHVRECVSQPHGIILATGPVGSGKTTTLYSCLSQLDSDSYNLMSIEDPVEVNLEGVNQVNVNYKLDFDFKKGLRSLLRHDPDVILIGEIRDDETASIAIRAAMTGMLVLSSLHTNDAPSAITTLYNFQLPSYLVANAVVGVIAQRLVRKVCDRCRVGYSATTREIEYLFRDCQEQPSELQLYRGEGCEHCHGSGFYGRIGIFEVLPVSDAIRNAILDNHTEREIRNLAVSEGMSTLRDDAREKAIAGVTMTDEIVRVLGR
jgi:type II secretory ATPase GspE/PulE/Tfp pilus assembly ATPase PilB-like protein